jgi:hypothetical protein
MSKVLGLALLFAAAGLGGCATVSPSSGMTASNECDHVDCLQMLAVEHVATQHGVNVVWINPPLRN